MTTARGKAREKTRYHHGDLRAALVDAATELIGERGVQGFSLAEVSRRVGVTVAAPYRHFADRDDVLAAVAVRACEILAASVEAEIREPGTASGTASAQLIAAGRGYVRCAASNRALFHALFGAGLDKSRYPEIDEAAQPIADAFLAPALVLCGNDADAHDLALGVVAAAHGHATLLLDGAFGHGQNAIGTALRFTSSVIAAIIEGRGALRAGPSVS